MRWSPIPIVILLAGCTAITNVDDLYIFVDGGGGDSDGDSDGDTDALECDPSVEDWYDTWAAYEDDLLDELNDYRESGVDCGVTGYFGPTSPLEMEYHLQCAARVHAKWMADNDSYGHDSPGGPLGDDEEERVDNAGYEGTFTGESISSNQQASMVADAMVAGPEHCARFMNPDTNHAGIGYAYDATTVQDYFWVMLFGQGD
jgi:uncharacterized protein YkwD